MPGAAGTSRTGWRGAALLAGLIAAGPLAAQPAEFSSVQVGQVTAFARAGELDLAVSLAEWADRPQQWYGVGRRSLGPLAIAVVRGSAGFEAWSRGRAPAWGAGLALPAARFVVVRVDGEDPFRVLRHELAHVMLHQEIRGRVPLWFDEGYAVLASGEFGRLARLELNLTVARGAVPTLDELINGLRGDRSTAEAAYALAGAAVGFLADRSPARGLEPILSRLARGVPFDSAVVETTGFMPGRFEEAWQREMKRRFGFGLWLVAGGMWAGVGALVVLAAWLRRRRDRPRRARLDEGWDVPPRDDEPESPPTPAPHA